MDYIGNHWVKCDLHLHTTASRCYKNQNDTFEDWISRVKEQGLQCVAVTDHNNYKSIDPLMELGRQNDILVLPGVEVTCDTSKIHILCIFGENENGDTVHDFLASVRIKSKDVGNPNGTDLSVLELCKEAKRNNALVIAAHIDEYNGINSCSYKTLKMLLTESYLDAVQVVNPEIWEQLLIDHDENEALRKIRIKYGSWDDENNNQNKNHKNEIKRELQWANVEPWFKAYKEAKRSGLPMIMSSDNPHSKSDAKHGLWGIGQTYTWIKTSSTISFESLRQALIINGDRVVTSYMSEENPETFPDTWIKSVTLNKSVINKSKLYVNFSPELNTIIGGRGTGKSSIIRLIGGVTNSIDTNSNSEIAKDQLDFYKLYNPKDGLGVFNDQSTLELEVAKNDSTYKIVFSAKDLDDKGLETYKVYRVDSDEVEEIDDPNFGTNLKLQVFTQKEIYEIGRKPNSLLKIIDQGINGIEKKKNELLSLNTEILHLYTEISAGEEIVKEEKSKRQELKDLQKNLNDIRSTEYTTLIKKLESNNKISSVFKNYIDSAKEQVTELAIYLNEFEYADDIEVPDEIKDAFIDYRKQIAAHCDELRGVLDSIQKETNTLNEKFDNSQWLKDSIEVSNKCAELQSRNINGKRIKKYEQRIHSIKEELSEIEAAKAKVSADKKKLTLKTHTYNATLNEIRKMRRDFIDHILGKDETIRINFVNNGNNDEFEEMLEESFMSTGKSIGKTLSSDIKQFADIVFNKKNGLNTFKEKIAKMRNKERLKEFSKLAHTVLLQMDQNEYNKLLAYVPSDEVQVQYRPSGSKKFKPLTAASAGQKTACILNIILSYGDTPLLLDQPEDDLDNKLVYDLIVKKLRVSKKNRQIIVVTHNANIPVNGDAECVISMDTASEVTVKTIGCIDDEVIRKEICNVMEGSKEAFDLRAKKYQFNKGMEN